MSQSAHPHRKLKITVVVALALVVTLLGFAGNFLFDFVLNPQAPYTMKIMQDGKDDKKVSSVEQLKHATDLMLFIHGAAHAKSAQVDPELYWNTVDNFLDEYF